MSGKDVAVGIALVVVIAGVVIYENKQPDNPYSGLGPALYLPGPNAESGECENIRKEFGAWLDRGVDETIQAEDRDEADFDRVMHYPATESQRDIALNNLFARQDVATTTREARKNNEEIRFWERQREAGCNIPNPNLNK